MGTSKYKILSNVTLILGIILILIGLYLFFPITTRSDTPDSFYYNIYILRYLLPVTGALLMLIGISINSVYESLMKEIHELKERCRSLEKELTK